MEYDVVSHAVSNYYGDKRRFSASLLTQKRSVSSSPSNFCFSVSCFNQGIVSELGERYGRGYALSEEAVQRLWAGDDTWDVDVSCYRQLIE